MSTLERAIAIAAEAHAGDTDKAGASYIFHPLRVMNACRTVEERIVAVLHDVVEDSPWTLERLRAEGFSEEVVDGVDALTRRDGEDSLDLDRIESPGPGDYERLVRYVKALAVLDAVDEAREW